MAMPWPQFFQSVVCNHTPMMSLFSCHHHGGAATSYPMTFLPPSHSTNRIIDVHLTTFEEISRPDGKAWGWGSCVNWENEPRVDLPVSRHSQIWGGGVCWESVSVHRLPDVQSCPVSKEGFHWWVGREIAAVRTGADRCVTQVESTRRPSRAPLTTQVRRCNV